MPYETLTLGHFCYPESIYRVFWKSGRKIKEFLNFQPSLIFYYCVCFCLLSKAEKELFWLNIYIYIPLNLLQDNSYFLCLRLFLEIAIILSDTSAAEWYFLMYNLNKNYFTIYHPPYSNMFLKGLTWLKLAFPWLLRSSGLYLLLPLFCSYSIIIVSVIFYNLD